MGPFALVPHLCVFGGWIIGKGRKSEITMGNPKSWDESSSHGIWLTRRMDPSGAHVVVTLAELLKYEVSSV